MSTNENPLSGRGRSEEERWARQQSQEAIEKMRKASPAGKDAGKDAGKPDDKAGATAPAPASVPAPAKGSK